MGIPVLVMGRSGSGKSRSLKKFDPSEIGVIKAIEKELPFRNSFSTFTTSNYSQIKTLLLKGKVLSFAIDDAGYLLTDEFIRRTTEKGYDKFNELASNFYDLWQFITTQLPRDKIVYIMMHEDENEITGVVKPKTIGKMLDEKVCVEGLFTIVLRCIDDNGEHKFITNGRGAKSPEEMFDSVEIENDLKYVDDRIREFYNLEKYVKKEKE